MDGTALQAAHKHSFRNRDEVRASTLCGCFHCEGTFASTAVAQWIDGDGETAVCPRCGIDSVIGDDSALPVSDPAFLDEMNAHFFAGPSPALWDADGKGVGQ